MSRPDAYEWQVRRPSVAGTFCKCVAAVLVTGIASGTFLAARGMHIFEGKAGDAMDLATRAVEGLPQFLRDLPPVFADAVKDRRDPAYAAKVKVHADAQADENDRFTRAWVEIQNAGDEVVSLMAVRVVALDKDGDPLTERMVHAATPLALEDEWRGPLFPGSTRRIPVRFYGTASSVEAEIAELRVWDQNHGQTN